MITEAPSATKRRAVAAPCPRAAPVISAGPAGQPLHHIISSVSGSNTVFSSV
jgi:hypothetical protein